MTDAFDAARYAALKQHEAHEQTLPEIEIVIKEYPRFTELSCEGFEVVVFRKSPDHDKYPLAFVGDDSACKTPRDFAILIALLQRAQSIIEGGV